MSLPFFLSTLFLLQLFYWMVARFGSRKVETKKDYFLAGKKVPFFPLMMTFFATQVGGGIILGAAEEAYYSGWAVLFYPLGAAIGLILLGSGIGKRLVRFNVSTVAEIFELVYASSFLKKLASLLSIASLFMILVSQIIASNKFLSSLGVHHPLLLIVFWTFVILYTVRGGLNAVIATDIAQACFFSLVFLFCFGFIFFSCSSVATSFSSEAFSSVLSSKIWAWFLMPSLFMLIEQDMGQRCFSGVSSKVVSRAAFWAGIATLIICIIPVFLGILANSLGVIPVTGESILMAIIQKLTNPYIAALAGCAILAAIISTATSLINAISSNITNDFHFQVLSRKEALVSARIITAFVSIGALFCSFFLTNIVSLLIQSYELSVSVLFAPILFALFKPKGNLLSACLSMGLGVFGFFFFRIYPISFPPEIFTLFLSLSGFLVGEMLSFLSKKIRV